MIVTRSAFCKECWLKGRPQKGERFMVFGTTSQLFKERFAHHDGIKGFTPHLYSIEIPYRLDSEGRVLVNRTCLIDGCGISIGSLRRDGKYTIEFTSVSQSTLSVIAADALITNWRSTGYELL